MLLPCPRVEDNAVPKIQMVARCDFHIMPDGHRINQAVPERLGLLLDRMRVPEPRPGAAVSASQSTVSMPDSCKKASSRRLISVRRAVVGAASAPSWISAMTTTGVSHSADEIHETTFVEGKGFQSSETTLLSKRNAITYGRATRQVRLPRATPGRACDQGWFLGRSSRPHDRARSASPFSHRESPDGEPGSSPVVIL